MEIKVKQYTATTTCDNQLTVTGYYVYDKYLDMHFIFVNETYGLKSYQIDITTLEEPIKLSKFNNNGTFDVIDDRLDCITNGTAARYTVVSDMTSFIDWKKYDIFETPDLIKHSDDAIASIRSIIKTQLESLADSQNNTVIPIDSMVKIDYKNQSDIYNTIQELNKEDNPPK